MQQAKSVAMDDEVMKHNPTIEARNAIELARRTNKTPPKPERTKQKAQRAARRKQRRK